MSNRLATRIGASIGAVALAMGAALATAAPATAATTAGDVTWYGLSDFGTESGGYPTGYDWFWGDTTVGASTSGFTANGLNITTNAGEAIQILNQNVPQPGDAAAFVDFIEGIGVYYFAGSTWSFQVPVFGEPSGVFPANEFTTLRPATDTVDPADAALWVTSRAFGAYAAGDTDSLANFAAALYAGEAPELLAVGLWVGEGWSADIIGLAIDGHLSAFTPPVTRTITPNPVDPTAATTSGIRFQGSGWIPGTEVYISIHTCSDEEEGMQLFFDNETVAAPDGTVDFTAILAELPAEGVYCVYFDDDDLLYEFDGQPGLELTIKKVLPPTGLEVTTPIAAGIAFLVLGGLALAVTRRVERRGAAA